MSLGCFVTDISWARVILTVTAEVPPDLVGDSEVQFALVDKGRVRSIPTERIDAGHYRLVLNITNFEQRRQIPNGTWRFVAYLDGEPGPVASFDLSRLAELDDDSRAFLYANNRATYVVTFGLSEADEPALLMRTYQLSRAAAKAPARGRVPLKRRLQRKLLPRPRRVRLANRFYRLARRVNPPDGTRILFASEMRSKLEGNLLRVRDRMVERNLDRTFNFRYSFRVPHTKTRESTLRLIWLLATSDIVLIDDYFALLETLQLAPETKIIQAWHAGSGFKNIGFSRFGNYGSPKLQNAHRKSTYALTGSKHLVPVYAEAFGIEESAVIPTGLPRIDTFLDPERTERVVAGFAADYPELRGKRVLLFAPTFRGRGARSAFYDYSRLDFAKLHEACGEDSVLLFRMHHFVRTPVPIPPEYADRLLDFAAFPDTNDLLHVTDVLITDYSSIIYEFSLLDRPMLFFAYDKDVYSATRGFHRDFDSTAPGRICETMDQLVKAIATEDYETWKIEAFRRENFDRIDTHAADRVIDWLILSDPRTSAIATSEAAHRDPATGDTALGDAPLDDQGDA